MAQSAVAQHDGLDHHRPMQVVGMVQRHLGRNPLFLDPPVVPRCAAAISGAVKAAGGLPGAAPATATPAK